MDKKIGRPSYYGEPMLKVAHTLPSEMVRELDAYAEEYGVASRSDVLRRMCQFLFDSPRLMDTALRNGS